MLGRPAKPIRLGGAGQQDSGFGQVLNRLWLTMRGRAARCLVLALGLVMVGVPCAPLDAAPNPKYASIVINAYTGKVLFSRHADARRYPASLTKMMTLYLLFEQLEAGKLTLGSALPVSKRAAGQAPSKLGLKAGETITVEQAINALVVKSANDVATVVAEKIAGTEYKFAQLMTQKAKELGMTRTRFRNASGLPNRKQYTTARDMATLGQRLILDFPSYYSYFSATSFTWKGKTYKTHNRLLKNYRGTDGIKTGYIRASGFNLTTSVKRDGYHLIGVVMGGRSTRTRDAHMRQILDAQFNRIAKDPSLGRRYVVIPKPMAKPGTQMALLTATAPPPAPRTPAPSSLQTRATMTPVIEEGDTSYENEEAITQRLAPLTPRPQGPDPIGDLIESETLAGTASLSSGHAATVLAPVQPTRSLQARLSDPEAFYGVQVGAYQVRDIAVQRLNIAAARAADRLRDVLMAVIPVDINGNTVYRARIGPYRELEAQNTCEVLVKEGVSCFTVIQENWASLIQ